MTAIPVFDVAKGGWTLQSTYYDEQPPQLAHFCAIVADAKDGGFDIFIYGGDNGAVMSAPYDDVWVLSVPTFKWTKAYGGNSTRHGRSSHVCSMPYPNQMLVVGGWNEV